MDAKSQESYVPNNKVHPSWFRYKTGVMGVKQAEPRLELKKHRRVSRKKINQSILDEIEDDIDDLDDDYQFDVKQRTRKR